MAPWACWAKIDFVRCVASIVKVVGLASLICHFDQWQHVTDHFKRRFWVGT